MKLQKAFFLVVALVFLVSVVSVFSKVSSNISGQAAVAASQDLSVDKILLINADTDTAVSDLSEGSTIDLSSLGTTHLNIEAKTIPGTVGSVRFALDATAPRIENTAPYAYAGDNGAGDFNAFNFLSGNHTLSITPFSGSRASGIAGITKTIHFSVSASGNPHDTTTDSQTTNQVSQNTNTSAAANTATQLTSGVVSFTLVNADTNQEIKVIHDNDIVDLSTIGTTNITLRADTVPTVTGSVVIDVNGSKRVENLFPYTFPAGSSDDYLPWAYNLNQPYTVTGIAYSKARATGIASAPYVVHFTVLNTNTSAPANQTTSNSHAPAAVPAVACLNANVKNDSSAYGAANPGAITISWDTVSGYPNYKAWRIKDGVELDTIETSGTGFYTSYLTPGNWTIRIALLDGTPNTGAAYGPTTEIGNLFVGTNYPASTDSTTCVTHNPTTSISITSPSNDANILTGQNFNYTVTGSPSSDQISEVKFYYRGEFYPVLLGTKSAAPFSIATNLGTSRGFNCPALYAVATLNDGSTLRSPKVYIVNTDTAATTPTAHCPNDGEAPDELDITTPLQGSTINAGQAFNITASSVGNSTLNYVKFFELGGNVAQNIATGAPGYTVTNIGTRTSAPYTISYSVATPGNYGSTIGTTNIIRAIAFYSNGKTKVVDVPIKVLPQASLPQIGYVSLVNTSGTSLVSSMTSGMTINIGTQTNATNPPMGQNIAFKANLATGSITPGSVGFSLQSTGNPLSRYDATAPYSLFGDTSATSFTAWTQPIALGAYTLVVTPYTGANGTGTAGASVTIPFVVVNSDDTTAPSVPAGLAVTYRSGSEIRLSWSASTGTPTAYKVYRNPGTTVTLGNVTSYTDTSVTGSGSYSYSVSSLDAVGNESGVSSSVTPPTLSTNFALNDSVTTTAAATPKVTPDGAPAGAQQPSDSVGTIAAGGSIYYNGAFYWNVNFATGTDGWVNQNSLVLAPTTPNAPTNFSTSALTDTSLTISWTDNATNETGFTLNRATAADFSSGFTTVSIPANSSSYAVTGLSPTTTYYFQLKANGATGDSAWATPNPLSVTTNQTTVSTTCNAGVVPVNNGTKRSIQLAAAASTNPASITICWPTITGRTVNGNITVARRAGYGASASWTTLTSALPSSSTSYTDSTAAVGQYYEYKVSFSQSSTNTNTGGGDLSGTVNGYIASGINVPLESYKGKIVLVVDNTFQTTLATQISQLIDDLNADRWAVLGPVYVNRTDTPSTVRTQIQNLYNANSSVKAVYLLGHVPVPYFGSMSVDGHASRGTSGDAYYGEMDSTWNSVASGCSTFSWSPVNAGTIDTPATSAEFCNTSTPSSVELEVGRVDMYQMPSFGGNETTLLGNYLTRAHNFKIHQYVPNETAFIKDGFNGPNGSQNGALNWYNGRLPWSTFPSLVGANNISVNNALSPTLDSTINGQNYEFVYGSSGGANCQGSADGAALGTTASLSTQQWGGVFNQLIGSYFGEWGCSDSFLRAPTVGGIGLANMYAGQRYWYLHSMAMGQNIGYGALMSVNNTTSLYDPVGGVWDTTYPGNSYMTLIGDPTLRMSYLAMPATFAVSDNSGQVAFSWGAVSGAEGYNIYEIQANSVQTNTVRKVNPSLITGTSYNSSDTYTAGKKYMVTAVKTKVGASGSYLNESLGKITTTSGQTQADTIPPSAPTGVISTAQSPSSITLDWTDSTGNPAGETVYYKIYRNSGGATAINETTPIKSGLTTSSFTDGTLTASTSYSYKVSAYDANGNESTHMPTTSYSISTTTPPDTTAPSVPASLAVTGATSSTLSLAWNNSTDNVAVTGYNVYRSTSSTGTYSQVGTASGTTYTDTGLNAATAYYYKVAAYDAAGNISAQSSSANGTTSVASLTGQVSGLLGGVGPNNTDDVTPTANPFGVTDYFIDCAAGNDANNGTTINTPWKTLAKFNSSGAGNLQPGSRVFIKRGGTCYGPTTDVGQYGGVLDSYKSGTSTQYVEYKAYGSGNAPVISGAMPVTNWSVYSGNIYKANIGANKNPRYLFVNNNIQTLARTPNRDASGNNVFLTEDDMNGQSGPSTYITDAGMPNSATTNLTGGSVFYRHDNFTWVTAPITAHSGTTLTLGTIDSQCYSPHCSGSIYPAAGWGYIIENKLSLLDTPGEWYYDKATGDVYLWAPQNANPNTLTVEASIQQNGMYMATNLKYVRVKNLVFEKFNYTPYGAVINMNDYSGAPGVSNNSIENVEIRNSFIGVRNQTNSTDSAKGNNVLNSYIHDLYSIGIYTYGYGHNYQGNVIENIAMKPEYAADTSIWGYFFGVYSLGGEPHLISNIIRNIGYIGINHIGNGEMRGNLLENTSMMLNDGCAICADGANNSLSVKKNIIKGIFGNLDGVPSTFIHATALGSGISTGDRSSIGGIFEDNVVTDFGNAGITLDNNYNSNNMTVRNNTVYTDLPGNATGAAGLKFMDQSVGVSHPPAGSPCSIANNGCYVANFNHQIYGNKVYMLNSNNHTLYFLETLTNGTSSVDFGNFYNNYLFDAVKLNNIVEDRRWVSVKTNDIVTIIKSPQTGGAQTINVYSAANAASTIVGQHTTGDKGTIVGASQVGNGINWWYVNFSTGVDGYIQEYNLELAPRNITEWETTMNEPPTGQTHNKANSYTISNQANYPSIYLNDTASSKVVNIGSGKCDKDKNPLSSSITLAAFGDAIVPENCADQP